MKKGDFLSAFTGGSISTLGTKIGLTKVGFTTSGVLKGSLAAKWHSSIGAVSSKSLFAFLQSIGAKGIIFYGPFVFIVGAGIGWISYKAFKKLKKLFLEKKQVL